MHDGFTSSPDLRASSQVATASLALPTVPSSKYRILTELGRGGMATAYLAWLHGPAGFNKLVVIKRLHPSHASEPQLLRMFLDEARLAARIDHPNVVHTNEVATDGENYFIAMEYIEGQTLELTQRKARGEKITKEAFPLNLQLHVIREVLAGLHFAHELRDWDGRALDLVHRDMSPHNVMITYEGHVKIVDFGIAKARVSTHDTSTGIVKGKAQYMPIEQFEGKNIDRRADLFAVGVMLWQALTGRKLWVDMSDAEIYRALIEGEVPPPRSVVPDVHPELEGICMRALAVKKEDRYATAADFQNALEHVVARNAELGATARELGAFVATLFADARAELRAKIERHPSGPPDSFAPSSVTTTPDALAPAHSPTTARTNKWAFAVAAVAVACGVGAFAARASRAPAAAQVTAAPAAETALSRVIVGVEPAEARVTVDGTTLDGHPRAARFARDRAMHVVEVDAPGFTTRREEVIFDSDEVRIDVRLVPSDSAVTVEAPIVAATTSKRAPVRAPRKSSAPVASPPTPPSPVAIAPAAEATPVEPKVTPTRRTRVIDKENPFRKEGSP